MDYLPTLETKAKMWCLGWHSCLSLAQRLNVEVHRKFTKGHSQPGYHHPRDGCWRGGQWEGGVRRPCGSGSWMWNFCSFSHWPRPPPTVPQVVLLSGSLPRYCATTERAAVEGLGARRPHPALSRSPSHPPATPSTCEKSSRLRNRHRTGRRTHTSRWPAGK